MAAGFRSPLFLLGLAKSPVQAGFRSPLFLLGIVTTQTQAGFRGAIPLPILEAASISVEAVDGANRHIAFAPSLREQLEREDEELMVIIQGFLHCR